MATPATTLLLAGNGSNEAETHGPPRLFLLSVLPQNVSIALDWVYSPDHPEWDYNARSTEGFITVIIHSVLSYIIEVLPIHHASERIGFIYSTDVLRNYSRSARLTETCHVFWFRLSAPFCTRPCTRPCTTTPNTHTLPFGRIGYILDQESAHIRPSSSQAVIHFQAPFPPGPALYRPHPILQYIQHHPRRRLQQAS